MKIPNRFDKYDLSHTNYTKTMAEKTALYNSLITKAERTNEEKGAVSKAEARLYAEAAGVCEEIMALNHGQRAVYVQWNRRKLECDQRVQDIKDIIAPEPETPEEKKPEKRVERERIGGYDDDASADGETVTLPSGFTTRNAIPEYVEAETIEGWFKTILDHDLNEVIGLEEQKSQLMKEAGDLDYKLIDKTLKISPLQSYLFYGPPGSGKTYLIEGFAAEMKKKGFRFLKLVGGDIHQGIVGAAEKVVKVAFREAQDKAPCIVFIDEFENVCVDRNDPNAAGHERATSASFLTAYNELRASGKRVVFLAATNYPGKVDGAMLDRFKRIRVPLPPVETREAIFARKLSFVMLEEGFTYREIAELTDNYSQRDMEHLVDAIRLSLKDQVIERYRVLNEEGKEIRPETDKRGSEAIEDMKLILTREEFLKIQSTVIPSDKTAAREALREFEDKLKSLG